MNLLFIFCITLIANTVYAMELVHCQGIKAIQAGVGVLQQESEFKFDLDRSNRENSIIKNFTGYFNVKTPFIDGEEITSNTGYRGQFSVNILNFDPNYRPVKYKNWVQFKNLRATFTDSLEQGMWGNFILDLFNGNSFQGRYLFQAGSHMGGTLFLSCRIVQ